MISRNSQVVLVLTLEDISLSLYPPPPPHSLIAWLSQKVEGLPESQAGKKIPLRIGAMRVDWDRDWDWEERKGVKGRQAFHVYRASFGYRGCREKEREEEREREEEEREREEDQDLEGRQQTCHFD